MYLNFTLDELRSHIERTPQVEIYGDAYNRIGHGDNKLRISPTIPLVEHLCWLIIKDVPLKRARGSVPFLAQFNPKIADPDASGYLRHIIAPYGVGMVAFDFNKPYKRFKDKLIQHSQRREVTTALFGELEQLTNYENSLDVFCMAYLLDMDVPKELKVNMHSDDPKKRVLATKQFEEISEYLHKHPEKNIPLRLSKLAHRFIGNVYTKLGELDHFYMATPLELLSPEDPERLEMWRRSLFNLFGIENRFK